MHINNPVTKQYEKGKRKGKGKRERENYMTQIQVCRCQVGVLGNYFVVCFYKYAFRNSCKDISYHLAIQRCSCGLHRAVSVAEANRPDKKKRCAPSECD